MSMANEDLVHAFEEKIRKNIGFTITSLSLHFLQILLSVVVKIVSGKLKFLKLCAQWVPKIFYRRTQIETAGHDVGLSDTVQ